MQNFNIAINNYFSCLIRSLTMSSIIFIEKVCNSWSTLTDPNLFTWIYSLLYLKHITCWVFCSQLQLWIWQRFFCYARPQWGQSPKTWPKPQDVLKSLRKWLLGGFRYCWLRIRNQKLEKQNGGFNMADRHYKKIIVLEQKWVSRGNFFLYFFISDS